MKTFESSVELPASVEAAFTYHERPGALQRLIPPWESVRIEASGNSIKPGARVTLSTRVAGFPVRWIGQHCAYDPPNRFEDVGISGPFTKWHHQHLFEATGASTSLMTDHVEYQVPLGLIGENCFGRFVHNKLAAMFVYRHRITQSDLEIKSRYALAPMRIGVTGASGLVGTELVPFLSLLGHQPLPATRQGMGTHTTFQITGKDGWKDCDVVVHLAGKPIADKRWNKVVKHEIRDSRVGPTKKLCEQLAALPNPPRVLVCASAIGIYGDRGNEIVDESSPAADDFLGDVAKDWEAACEPARRAGIRVVNLRFGIILTPRGGALAKLLLPTKLCLAGPMGSGRQWWSWIAMDDVLGAIYHVIANESVNGPVNVVAPHPVSNRDFISALGKVLSRPTFMSAPTALLRLALGEAADALLLSSTRVQPSILQSTGYQFRYPFLETALRHLLGRVSLISAVESPSEEI